MQQTTWIAVGMGLSMIFGSVGVAPAAEAVSHPFVTDRTPAGNNARIKYTAGIIEAAVSVAKDKTDASLRVGSYAVRLEARLAALPDKFTPFVAPERYIDEMLQFHGLTPTTQFPRGHATMCLEQDRKVLGAWKIYLAATSYYAPDGKLAARFDAGQVVSSPVIANTPEHDTRGRPACWATLLAAREEIKADHALATAGK